MERYNVSRSPWTFITDGDGNVLDYRFGAVDKAEFLTMPPRLPRTGHR